MNNLISRDGSVTRLAEMNIYGWVDAKTIISDGITTNFKYISLTDPMTAIDLGFHGIFVGAIRG